MKDKIVSIGLGIVLAASLVGNVYIYNQQQTLTAKLAAQEQQAATLTTQIAYTDAQKQQLQGQLEQLDAQLKAAQDETTAAKEQAAQLMASIPVVPAFAPSPASVEKVQGSKVNAPTANDVNDYLKEVLGGGNLELVEPHKGSNSGINGNLGDASQYTGDDVLGGFVDPSELTFK